MTMALMRNLAKKFTSFLAWFFASKHAEPKAPYVPPKPKFDTVTVSKVFDFEPNQGVPAAWDDKALDIASEFYPWAEKKFKSSHKTSWLKSNGEIALQVWGISPTQAEAVFSIRASK